MLTLIVLLALPAIGMASGVVLPGGRQPAAIAKDGTPAAGAPRVIEAHDEPRSATPRGEQVLRLAGPRDGSRSLDPALARDLSTAFLVRQIFRGLTRLDQDLHAVPDLAERIEISPDGLDYTFRLRRNLSFQDGRPITADDVLFSLSRALDPDTAGGDASLLAGPAFLTDIDGAPDVRARRSNELSGVQKIDERTVRIHLVAPRATFLMQLAAAPGGIVDRLNVSQQADWWRSPNGSGPFRVAQWQAGEELTVEANARFYAGRPPLDRVEVSLGPGAAQAFNLYQAGKVDIDPSLPSSVLDRVTDPASPLYQEVTTTRLFAVEYIAFRTDSPPMDDPHIRRAVQLAFPREKVASVTYDGRVSAATGLIPDGMLGRAWPARVEPYNLAAARREVAASRYGSPDRVPPLRIYIAGDGAAASLRDTLQPDLGLRVEVISVGWPEFLTGLSEHRYPAYELYWGADYPDPASVLGTLFGAGSADNYSDYQNAAMNNLLTAAARELDPVRRGDLYQRAQQQLLDDDAVIPLYHDVGYAMSKPYVKGLEMTPLGILRLDTIWLEH